MNILLQAILEIPKNEFQQNQVLKWMDSKLIPRLLKIFGLFYQEPYVTYGM